MQLGFSILWILVLLVLIVVVCELFTNAIEWTGKRFNLSKGAVGSVLAAVGTALPETLVPIVAILSGILSGGKLSADAGHDIGIGAILGAPFLLSTLAMFVSGFAAYFFAKQGKRPLGLDLHPHLFLRDMRYFFAAYVPVFLAAWISDTTVKTILALGLLAFYGWYVKRTLDKEHMDDEDFELEPLKFAPKSADPSTTRILTQVVISLLGIVVLAHLFVEQINFLSGVFHLNALIISLIICPIATELPEKFNSVVWIGQKKDVLALGNITGAMVFQSCIPGAIGLLFTPWVLNNQAILSVVLCLLSSAVIYFFAFRWPEHPERQIAVFMTGGLFYLIFLWNVISALVP